ncbi:putative involucrin repeat protein [Venturia nashicola]|uniref:Putative involucrin repeat protein n=1 Tax=Venturia nashicola TaxID=86259 RepID=A0A4Z1P073_9PEZI|nr:putative involucrin repeat protein [Venturia nashicola]TLD20799.1 putative involucrin repeat protein [Venturia nashicola]
MQNGTSQQQMLPNAAMTYSVASSLYPDQERMSILPPPSSYYGTPLQPQTPSSETLLGAYQSSDSSARQSEPYQTRQRISPTLSDPIQTHLLVETAIGDCQQYDVLSFEDLESLKKEDILLRKRIYGLRRRLVLETKVRDAAKSLTRLHSNSRPSSAASSPTHLSRRGSLFSRKETEEKANLELELASAVKKCDELSRELYSLEQRSRDAQTRILQHTAGILQLTHKGLAKTPVEGPFVPGGRPESPASLDGHTTQDRGLQNGESTFDSMLESFGVVPRRRSFQGNSKIPIETLLTVAKRLDDLNSQVRETISQSNPEKAQGYPQSPPPNLESVTDTMISRQLEVLGQGIEDLKIEQNYMQQESESRSTSTARIDELEKAKAELQIELQASLQENMAMEDRLVDQLGDVNRQLFELLVSLNSSSNAGNIPPIPYNEGPMALIQYTNERLATVKTIVHTSAANAEKNNQTDAVLQGLWQFILGAEDDLKDRKRAERDQIIAKRDAGGEDDPDDESSPDEDDGLPEEFSLQSFNTKVQWLVSRSAHLKEKQTNLRRQVSQHRAVASRGMAAGPIVDDLQAELERLKAQHASTQEEFEKVSSRHAELEILHEKKNAEIQSLSMDLENATQAAQDETRIAIAKADARIATAEQNAKGWEEQLTALSATREAETQQQEDQEHVFRKTESELRDLEGEVVRLTTELTICKAELDAAFGSRSQRQADAAKAADSEAAKKLDVANAELSALRMASSGASSYEQELKQELADTLQEFEELTRASVEQEKERDELESQLDQEREQKAELENRLAEEQVKWLGMMQETEGGKGLQGMGSGAMVLKNEFKKMMRETRTEHMKALRAEQEERRRLEALVRTLKKSGEKSSLSYSMTA